MGEFETSKSMNKFKTSPAPKSESLCWDLETLDLWVSHTLTHLVCFLDPRMDSAITSAKTDSCENICGTSFLSCRENSWSWFDCRPVNFGMTSESSPANVEWFDKVDNGTHSTKAQVVSVISFTVVE